MVNATARRSWAYGLSAALSILVGCAPPTIGSSVEGRSATTKRDAGGADDSAASGTSGTSDCAGTGAGLVAVIADEATATALKPELERYAKDIGTDPAFTACVVHRAWSKPEEVRAWLIDTYAKGHLRGAVLVGDIPLPLTDSVTFGKRASDWFYEDLDGVQADANGNGLPDGADYNDGRQTREIWTARLYPPTGMPDRVGKLRAYFDRNHDYRAGKLTYSRALVFPLMEVTEPDSGPFFTQSAVQSLTSCMLDASGLYTDSSSTDLLWTDDTAQYLQALGKGYEYVNGEYHGTPTTFGDVTGRISVDWKQVEAAKPKAFFVDLTTCSNGYMLDPHFIAGSYLFGGETQAVYAATAPLGVATSESDLACRTRRNAPMMALANGATLGEVSMHRDWDIMTLFGDPTLRMRPVRASGKVRTQKLEVDFGSVTCGTELEKDIPLQNDGDQPLTLRAAESYGDTSFCDPTGSCEMAWNVWDESAQDWMPTVFFDSEVVVPPHSEVSLRLKFGVTGCAPSYKSTRTMSFDFATSDGNTPFVRLLATVTST